MLYLDVIMLLESTDAFIINLQWSLFHPSFDIWSVCKLFVQWYQSAQCLENQEWFNDWDKMHDVYTKRSFSTMHVIKLLGVCCKECDICAS